MRRYKKYMAPYWESFLLAPVLILLEVAGEVMLPKLMSLIINQGVASGDQMYILQTGIKMLLLAAMMTVTGISGAYFAARASIGFTSDLRSEVFARVQQFSFQKLDEFSTGSLITRLTNDMQQVQNLIMMSLRMLPRAPGMLAGSLIMAFVMNAKLAVIILIVIPILAGAIFFILAAAFPRFEFMQKRLDILNNGIQEVLTNVRVVKSFVREEYEAERFAEMNEELKDSSLRALRIMITTMPVMTLAMNVTTLAVVWQGGSLILAGHMPVGDLTAFTTYIVQILMALMMFSMVLLHSSRAIASLKRINEVLDCENDLTDENAEYPDALVSRGEIEFQNVGFSYRKGTEPVLKRISLKIKAGETVGIIGATGSGKTSLVQLIPRLYDVTDGRVLVDGIDVRSYKLKHLRDGVGMVLQKNVLFSGTIEENLRWGNPDAVISEVRAAASSAQADAFVASFTNGYETELGQGGVNLSGGQKQRLCIARALLKKPKILILDDSTSAVDTATEAEIRKAFRTSLKDTTKLIIAQRISSVEDADQILVMDDGEIIGQGNHETLLETCEAYREIYETQHGGKPEQNKAEREAKL